MGINADKIEMMIASEELSTFIAYLVVGVLVSIKDQAVSFGVGIWSLRRLVFFEPLKKILPKEIIEVLESCNELSALEEFSKKNYQDALDHILKVLTKYLKQMNDPNFIIKRLVLHPALRMGGRDAV